jgi:hypothetical protein
LSAGTSVTRKDFHACKRAVSRHQVVTSRRLARPKTDRRRAGAFSPDFAFGDQF